jgi:hypothetical protein
MHKFKVWLLFYGPIFLYSTIFCGLGVAAIGWNYCFKIYALIHLIVCYAYYEFLHPSYCIFYHNLGFTKSRIWSIQVTLSLLLIFL